MAYYIHNLLMPRRSGGTIRRRNSPCGAGHNYTMIDHKGTIWPCHRFDGAAEDANLVEEMKMGNIYEGRFNEQLSNAFRNFDHSILYKPECKTCPVEPICGGFCPAANLQHAAMESRSIYKPHFTYCQLKWILYAKTKVLYDRLVAVDLERCHAMFQRLSPTDTGEK